MVPNKLGQRGAVHTNVALLCVDWLEVKMRGKEEGGKSMGWRGL